MLDFVNTVILSLSLFVLVLPVCSITFVKKSKTASIKGSRWIIGFALEYTEKVFVLSEAVTRTLGLCHTTLCSECIDLRLLPRCRSRRGRTPPPLLSFSRCVLSFLPFCFVLCMLFVARGQHWTKLTCTAEAHAIRFFFFFYVNE